MRSLDVARATCEKFHPGLCDALAATPLPEIHAGTSRTDAVAHNQYVGYGAARPCPVHRELS